MYKYTAGIYEGFMTGVVVASVTAPAVASHTTVQATSTIWKRFINEVYDQRFASFHMCNNN